MGDSLYHHRFDSNPHRRAIVHWFLLAFNAGCVNAGSFMAAGRFCSHVTGFATLFGVDLADQNVALALSTLSSLVFFLAGAMIAGLFIDRPIHFGRKPHYDYVMGLCALSLFVAGFAGGTEQFGAFGRVYEFPQKYPLLVLLCLACGLQNGALTSSSGSSVRTSHMTGLTTDLGLGLARLLTFSPDDERYGRESVSNLLRAGTILSFIVGSEIGALLFVYLHFLGFLAPASVALYAAWHGRRFKHAAHRQDGFEMRDVPELRLRTRG